MRLSNLILNGMLQKRRDTNDKKFDFKFFTDNGEI